MVIAQTDGLERLLDSRKPGIQALLRESGLKERLNGKKLKSWHIGFVLGPRLNAAGRIEDAKLALSLLLSQDEGESFALAKRIEELNEQRKQEQENLVELAIEQVVDILTDAVQAPSAVDRQPWFFVVAQGRRRCPLQRETEVPGKGRRRSVRTG